MAKIDANTATIYLIGAGPGDPGLITVRGAELLARADVVFYDYLVNPRIVELAAPLAERICLGRHGHGRLMRPEEAIEQAIARAKAGQRVVRLKGGDPAVFARCAEETEAMTAANVPYEIVPGVTAALAVGSYAGIPLTHRLHASAVALVTGQQGSGEGPLLDYAQLASFPGTLIFYMGVTTASEWTDALLAGGKSPDTPAAIVRRCSFPDQQTIRCTLENVPQRIAELSLRPPAIVVVGEVASLEPTFDWFSNRPLFSRCVLVTRAVHQADEMADRFRHLGADVLVQPAIEILPPDDWSPVDGQLVRLTEFDWIVFSSGNGVRFFLDRLLDRGGDLRQLGSVKIAAIGSGTAAELARFHIHADVTPEAYRSEALAETLAPLAHGKRFLLVRASRGREVLAEGLAAAGASVEQTVVYRSVDVEGADGEIVAAMEQGAIDWTTVTSSAIARSLVSLFGDRLKSTRLASISPVTSATLGELGYPPAIEATDYSIAGVVDAILRAEAADD